MTTLYVAVREQADEAQVCELIPLKPPSLNDFTNRRGLGAKFRYRDIRRKWDKWIPPPGRDNTAISSHGLPEFRCVAIVRILGPKERKYDPDDFIGGCKPILDILKLRGFIIDDKEKWCAVRYEQWDHYRKHGPQTLVVVSKSLTR